MTKYSVQYRLVDPANPRHSMTSTYDNVEADSEYTAIMQAESRAKRIHGFPDWNFELVSIKSK